MSKDTYESSRRGFIKAAGLLGASSILAGCAKRETQETPERVKNVIFLVVDGMGAGTLSLTNFWNCRQGNEEMHWLKLYSDKGVVRSVQDTASANSSVTDSAAAASAWGSGQRVNNGSVNVSITGEKLEPIGLFAKSLGKSLGLVTTTRLTHATPAGFLANVPSRGLEERIADQYLQREADVYLGGGKRFLKGKLEEFEKRGYLVAENKKELKQAEGAERLLGVFAESHLPYAIDRENQSEFVEVPSLEEMFQTALKTLEKSAEGFVLQVEGGRVDHAGHVNDGGAIVHEMLEFDRCIPIALEFVRQNPETLLIVTTDHGTGGCQLNGVGSGYVDTDVALDRVANQKGSFEWLEKHFKQEGRYDAALFEQVTGLKSRPEAEEKINVAIQANAQYLTSVIADAYAEDVLNQTGVGWTSHNHTSEYVDLLAIGAGAKSFPTYLKNNEVHGVLCDLLQRS